MNCHYHQKSRNNCHIYLAKKSSSVLVTTQFFVCYEQTLKNPHTGKGSVSRIKKTKT